MSNHAKLKAIGEKAIQEQVEAMGKEQRRGAKRQLIGLTHMGHDRRKA
jgi:hypothetical protein